MREGKFGDNAADQLIYSSLSQDFAAADETLFLDVSVSVLRGRVLLVGAVDNPQARLSAVRLAYRSEGVVNVINEIQIEPQFTLVDWARDQWIETRLLAKMIDDERIRSSNYLSRAVNGQLYLFGMFRTPEEAEALRTHARSIPRVHRVVDHLFPAQQHEGHAL